MTPERLGEVEGQIFDLFAQLGASDEQLDYQVLYASAREVSLQAYEQSVSSFGCVARLISHSWASLLRERSAALRCVCRGGRLPRCHQRASRSGPQAPACSPCWTLWCSTCRPQVSSH